jgi:hypothetical protein
VCMTGTRPRLLLTYENGRSFPSATNVGGYTQSLPTPRLVQVRQVLTLCTEASKKFTSQKNMALDQHDLDRTPFHGRLTEMLSPIMRMLAPLSESGVGAWQYVAALAEPAATSRWRTCMVLCVTRSLQFFPKNHIYRFLELF